MTRRLFSSLLITLGIWVVVNGLIFIPNTSLIPEARAITVGTFPPVHIVSKYGYVFRRGLVLTANGDPIFATFDDKGKVVREIGAATGAYQDAFVMSVPEYQVWLKRSQDGVNAGNVLMSSTEYKGATFETVDKKPVTKPALQDTTKSVLVLAPDKILTVNDAIVVEELPIDTTQVATLEASAKSLLINKDGLVVVQDANPIGFRTAFLNDTQTNTSRDSLAAVGAGDGNLLNYPLPGVLVETSMGGVGSTDGSGRYGLFDFYPPCPGFSYDINNWVTAKFPYTTANPKAGYMAHYVPFSVQSSVACVGTTDVVFPGIIPVFTANSNIISYPRANIAVDAFMLTGTVHLANSSGDSVPADVATTYGYDSYANTRLLDQGLLTGISQDDLLKTDAYIFRESDGLMIGELRGMQLYEPSKNDPVQRAYFRQFLPGFRDTFIFHNHPPRVAGLRVGEKIRVVAINRATGYMASKTLEATPTQPNGIEIALGDMALMPPNLKFKVMREFDPFIRADLGIEVKESQIAFEGSGLSSDKKILVYSEWLDQDGKPLPETLPGYTGRITKVIQANTLANSGADVAQFEVIPNGHLQLVKFPNVETTAREHFYIHINGEDPKGGNPVFFGAVGAGNGALQFRPKLYVPILAQIPDIAASNAAKQAAIDLYAQEAYRPVYQWKYRPEVQYTVYDFDPKNIRQANAAPNDTNVIQLSTNPDVIQQLVDGYAVVIGPQLADQFLAPLDRFGTSQREFNLQLADSYGNVAPVTVTVDQNGAVTISDPTTLATTDFSMISLFQTDDPENILWSSATAMSVDVNRDQQITFASSGSQVTVLSYDKTPTAQDPFIFWVNNDYDLINDAGTVLVPSVVANGKVTAVSCTSPTTGQSQQCEEEDANNLIALDNGFTTINNTMPNDMNHIRNHTIENKRDLEDFFLIRLDVPPALLNNQDNQIYLITHGIKANLFKAINEGKNYLTDLATADQQLTEARAMYLDPATPEQVVSKTLFDKNGTSYMLMEGVEASTPGSYMELVIRSNNTQKVLSSISAYLQFRNIEQLYEHYTVGDNTNGVLAATPSSPLAGYLDYNSDSGLSKTDDYILFVHGWRMQRWERRRFAETAFKRLYWSKFRGKFGFFSWPTDWFNNPAYQGDFWRGMHALGDPQNYSRSEATARRTGRLLHPLMTQLRDRAQANGGQLHVFAHSMGNVVVSEALKDASRDNQVQLVTTYVASQAAEVAGAYNPAVDDMITAVPPGYSLQPGCSGASVNTFEVAWRCSNIDSIPDNPFDIPPDKYRFTIPDRHTATNPVTATNNQTPWGAHYYQEIASKAGSIVNFNNRLDSALDAWEIQQFTKPDAGTVQHSTWAYSFSTVDAYGMALDEFWVDPPGWNSANHNRQIVYNRDDRNPQGEAWPEILAHIIPGRTFALGAVPNAHGAGNTVRNGLDMNSLDGQLPIGFSNSNYDHSAQFLSTYQRREGYWNALLDEFGIKR